MREEGSEGGGGEGGEVREEGVWRKKQRITNK